MKEQTMTPIAIKVQYTATFLPGYRVGTGARHVLSREPFEREGDAIAQAETLIAARQSDVDFGANDQAKSK